MEFPRNLFHLAVPVNDLAAARRFYGEVLGCPEGRSSDRWVDFDLRGHQFVVHLDEEHQPSGLSNPVDGHDVPIPHFGLVLDMASWREIAGRLADAHADFVIEPTVRFEGEPGEQATLFVLDPSGNALEFKAFADWDRVFAK